MVSALFLAAFAAAVVFSDAHNCEGGISGFVNEDVHVTNGTTCYLTDGAVVNGSVYLRRGANLHARGRVAIHGIAGVNGRQSGWIDFWGDVSTQQVDVFEGKWTSLYGARITNGELKIEASKGDLVLCGTSVSDVVEFKENTGNFWARADWWSVKGWWGCTQSRFWRDVKVEFLKGNVEIVDQEVEPGELFLKGVSGTTTLRDVESRKLKIERSGGLVHMYDVEAMEAELKMNRGGVEMFDVDMGKIKCEYNSRISGYDNEFELGEGQCNRPEWREN